ncbi:MAG: C4-dicarboxylate ABC transporter, partial [Chloroflexi bacterium]|nr:C4-dicarboxylate ABC transporter [Chloroflexota bacterium]
GEKADDEAIELIKKQGVEVTQLPREQLRASMKAVYDDFTPRIGVDIMAKAQAAMGSR